MNSLSNRGKAYDNYKSNIFWDLYVTYYNSPFILIILFNPYNKMIKKILLLLLFPFYW